MINEIQANKSKFGHLQKLPNQSKFNKIHVIRKTDACTIAFTKATNLLVVPCRETCVKC